MDAARKTKVEQGIFAVLLVVFGVTLLTGPLKQMGFFRASAPQQAATPVATAGVNMSQPLAVSVKEYRQKIDQEVNPQDDARPQQALPPSTLNYTAQELRNPLKSLLPGEPSGGGPHSGGPFPPPAQPPAPAPPALRLQGLLWGGIEPQAIINDHVYRVGELVAGAKILAIDRHGVTIEHRGASLVYSPSSSQPEGSTGASTGSLGVTPEEDRAIDPSGAAGHYDGAPMESSMSSVPVGAAGAAF